MKKKQQELQVEYWALARLKPYPKNARSHPPDQVTAIKRSIEAVGFTKPILVDDRGEILAGHGAYMAAQQIEMEKVPVIVRRGLSQAQKRAYRIADNKVAEGSSWDQAILAVEFADLQGMGVDLALTGFDPKEIELILKPPPSSSTEPPVPQVQAQAVSRLGDIWVMGEHRLSCGDATKAATMKALMAGAQAQCVFTDPPYGVSYEAPGGRHEAIQGDQLRRGQLRTMLHGAFSAAATQVREDAGWYVWHASSTREEFANAMRDVGLVELGTIIWVKPGMKLGWSDYQWAHEPCFYASRQGVRPAFHGDRTQTSTWRVAPFTDKGEEHVAIGSGLILTTKEGEEVYLATGAPKGRKVRHVHVEGRPVLLQASGDARDDVWEVSRDTSHGKEGALHPTQKPVELARRAIANSTTKGQVVLDMFSGSAITIIGCEQLERVGYACDLDPLYVDVGVRRWQELTGKQAIHATEKKTFDAIASARGTVPAKRAKK